MKVQMESKPCDKNLQLTKLFMGRIRGLIDSTLIQHDHYEEENYDEMELHVYANSYSEAFDKLCTYAKARYDEVLQVSVVKKKYLNILS